MKPLYDRYRLVKQILCRASTIPVIVSIASQCPLQLPALRASATFNHHTVEAPTDTVVPAGFSDC